MSITLYVPAIVAVVGAILYLAGPARASALAGYMFLAGLFVTLLHLR